MSKLHPVLHSILFLSISLILMSCSKDSVVEPETPVAGDLPVRTVTNLNTTGSTTTTNKFTYYRFSDSTVVTGADTATNKWDIAFRTTTILINGGAARFGNGGAIVMRGSSFDNVTTAPETGWGIDTLATSKLAITTGSGNGWYTYDFGTNTISAIEGVVLLIRTGDGKYAKMKISSYYKDSDPQPMPNPMNFQYYNFKYTYQPNGSRQVK